MPRLLDTYFFHVLLEKEPKLQKHFEKSSDSSEDLMHIISYFLELPCALATAPSQER